MTTTGFFLQLLQLAIALLLAPVLVGWVNMCRAWLQNKSAPSILLPYRTIRKLFHKDAVVSPNASPIFRLMPYIIFGAMALAVAIVPSLATDLPFARAADAIALVGLFALARVFIALAAMDIGTAFGSLGARREMFVGFLAEPALLMVLFTASLISGLDLPAHDRRDARPPRNRDLSQPRIRRRRVHDRVACRDAASRSTSRDTPRADDDPRSDDPRVLGAPSGADRVGLGTEAVQLLVHRPCAVAAVRHRRAGRGLGVDSARDASAHRKARRGRLCAGNDRNIVGEVAIFRAPEFLGTAFLLAVLGLLVTQLLGG